MIARAGVARGNVRRGLRPASWAGRPLREAPRRDAQIDLADDLADRVDLAHGADPAQDPGDRRADLVLDLVGLEDVHRLVLVDGRAVVDEPFGEGGLGHLHAELRDPDLDRHHLPNRGQTVTRTPTRRARRPTLTFDAHW